jgi:hypothetical protein
MYSTKIRHGTRVVVAGAVLLALANVSIAASIAIFNTGTDGSNNAWINPNVVDIHYSYLVQPGSAVPVTVNDSTFPFPPWFVNNYGTPGSRWIGPDQSSQGPAGNYVYRTSFFIPNNAILSTVSISGVWGTDDGIGNDIRINTFPTGQTTAGFTTLVPFSVTNNFIFGNNTLDFYLTNAGGPTGLRVDGILGTYQIPEPAALTLLCGALLIGFGVHRRRRC